MFGDALSRAGRGDGGADDSLPRDGRDGSDSVKSTVVFLRLIGVK